jgi:hypothetical protein
MTTLFSTDDLARSLVRALTTDGLLMLVGDALTELHRRDGEVEIVKGSIETHHAEIRAESGVFGPVYWASPEGAMESLSSPAQIDRAKALVEQLSRKTLDAPIGHADLTELREALGSAA